MPMPGGNEYTRPSFQRGVRSLHLQGGPNPYLSSYGHRPNNIHEQRRLNYDWNSQQALYGTVILQCIKELDQGIDHFPH